MSKTILIVEDYEDIRAPLKLWLEAFGHLTVEAADARRGVECVKNACPDLILMDIGLPGLTGLTATKQIRDLKQGKTFPS